MELAFPVCGPTPSVRWALLVPGGLHLVLFAAWHPAHMLPAHMLRTLCCAAGRRGAPAGALRHHLEPAGHELSGLLCGQVGRRVVVFGVQRWEGDERAGVALLGMAGRPEREVTEGQRLQASKVFLNTAPPAPPYLRTQGCRGELECRQHSAWAAGGGGSRREHARWPGLGRGAGGGRRRRCVRAAWGGDASLLAPGPAMLRTCNTQDLQC